MTKTLLHESKRALKPRIANSTAPHPETRTGPGHKTSETRAAASWRVSELGLSNLCRSRICTQPA
jgi:hypothetical protein